MQAIDTLALNLQNKWVFPHCLTFAKDAIQSGDSNIRAAGCTVLVVCAEGCCDTCTSHLAEVLQVHNCTVCLPSSSSFTVYYQPSSPSKGCLCTAVSGVPAPQQLQCTVMSAVTFTVLLASHEVIGSFHRICMLSFSPVNTHNHSVCSLATFLSNLTS